jgi:hypothetical protein
VKRASILILLNHVVKRKSGNGGIWHLVLVCKVGYKHRRVLFKLSEVKSDILLIELSIVVVLHVLGNHKWENGVS